MWNDLETHLKSFLHHLCRAKKLGKESALGPTTEYAHVTAVTDTDTQNSWTDMTSSTRKL